MAKYSSYNGVSCGNITSINDTTQISINNINSLSLCSAQSNPAMTRLVAGFSAGYISQAPTGSLNNDTVWETNDYKPATAAVNKNLKEIVYGKDGSGNPLFVIVTDAATNSMRRISRSDLVAKNDWTEITFVNPPDRPGDDPPSHKQQTVQWGNDVWMSAGNMGDGGGFYTYYYIWRSTNGTTWNGISLTGSTVSGSGANKITIQYSDFTTVIWKMDGDRYSRFIIDAYSSEKEAVAHNFISQDGNYTDILSSETIVVIQGALYKDKATTLPSILTVGIGDLFIFNNGKYVQGTWRRTDISESFEFFDINQNPIEVPPSSQWIHIVPNEGQIVWSSS